MASYEYRCRECGDFEVNRSVYATDTDVRCPDCGASARRVFSGPTLIGGLSPLRRVREAAAQSAWEPDVVGAPPASARRVARTPNPLHAALPRP